MIEIGIDLTDHMVFLCGHCGKKAKVVSVETEKLEYGPSDMDTCTYVFCKCETHGDLYCRKFYWNHGCQVQRSTIEKAEGE